MPISIIFGSRSWMDVDSGYSVKHLRPKSYVEVSVIKGAGHHVYADRPSEFNAEVNRICRLVDEAEDQLPNTATESCDPDANVESTSSEEKLNNFLNPS